MKKKYIFWGIPFVIIIVIAFIFVLLKNNSDALKFKEEYEALNGTIRESDGANYNDIKVDKHNPIKYIDAKKAIDVLSKEKAIIYVGAAWCPWCRNAVPVLFEVAKEYDADTIYYLDLDDEKSMFEVKDDKLVKTVDGTKEYYKLLSKLNDRLSDYTLKDSNGNVLNTGEKRIYMPYVIGIKSGRVVADHTGTVNLEEGQTKYSKLTKSQHEELKQIYSELFEKVYEKNGGGTCDVNEVCD